MPRTPKADRDLLREIYIFVAMKHRATDPWRKALNRWRAKVEQRHGWKPFEQIEKSRKR
jgi:hypothetical protein